MKLWLISQDVNTGYDTYDSAVVAAEDAEAACRIHPTDQSSAWTGVVRSRSWAPSPADVRAELIGDAVDGTPAGVILASFNAG